MVGRTFWRERVLTNGCPLANEIYFSFSTGKTAYILVRDRTGQIWNGASFVAYATANYSLYTVAATEQGTASHGYAASFPTAIVAGTYSVEARQQLGGSAAETDPTVATGNYEWNGTQTFPLADLATSGQVGQLGPLRLARGVQVLNFPFYLVSSSDHVTPLTSGVCSGQIARDGGAFGVLQSGTVSEIGLGFYKCTLTSGDLLANTAALLFTANAVSGGQSDPRPFSFVLQKTSGQ